MKTSFLNNAPINGSVTLVQSRFSSTELSPTPANTEQVKKVEELVSFFPDQILDSTKLTLLYKILKAARLAIVDRVVLNHTNMELLAINLQKK